MALSRRFVLLRTSRAFVLARPMPIVELHHPLTGHSISPALGLPPMTLDVTLPAIDQVFAWPPSTGNTQLRWEDQLIMQPPTQSLRLFYRISTENDRNGSRFRWDRALEDPLGIRLGFVVEAMREMVREAETELSLHHGWTRKDDGRLQRGNKIAEHDFIGQVLDYVLESAEIVQADRWRQGLRDQPPVVGRDQDEEMEDV